MWSKSNTGGNSDTKTSAIIIRFYNGNESWVIFYQMLNVENNSTFPCVYQKLFVSLHHQITIVQNPLNKF